MKGSKAMILRLNLCSDEPQTPFYSAASSPNSYIDDTRGHNVKHSTPVSSPEEPSTSYTRTTQESSTSSSDTITSPYLVYGRNPLFGLNNGNYSPSSDQKDHSDCRIRPNLSTSSDPKAVFYIVQNHSTSEKSPARRNYQNTSKNSCSILQYNQDRMGESGINQLRERDYAHSLSIRNAMSLRRNSSIPPPLCSLCKHKAPVFGKPPRQFDYEELTDATDRFSNINFLAEGGFGKVYRGVLRDRQVVAVKKLKFVGSQGDDDFCREVRVLSCAQHRNVVLLIGFCAEGRNRLLVYEYICNGSLDFHLHGNKRAAPLDWQSRQKIAIGAARGLRYLHEDCRVGCIVHRDTRPNNILLTHDHEPLVADFGLARLHNDSDDSDERVFGTIGYLAPEYFNHGEITEKVDIYAFGLILLELITGRKIIDLQLEPVEVLVNIYQLLDPCLAPYEFPKFPQEVQAMSHVAFLCLQQDPESRPQMSKVLRMLEGADIGIALHLDLNTVGNRSGHMKGLRSNIPFEPRGHSRNLSH